MTVKGIEMRRTRQLLPFALKMVLAGTAAKALGLAFAVANVALIAYSHPGALTASGPGNGGLQKAACALRASSGTANIRTKVERSATILLPNSVARPGTDQNSMGRLSQIL